MKHDQRATSRHRRHGLFRATSPPRRAQPSKASDVISSRAQSSNTPWSVFLHVLSFLTQLMTSLCANTPSQSALFNFQSLLLVILLLICTCTYVRAVAPRLIDSNKEGYVISAFIAMWLCLPFTFP